MIVVAFPGGAGGHFVGYMARALLAQLPVDTTATVNFHKQTRADQKFLDFSMMDHNQSSWEEELCYIRSIKPQSTLVLGHFRNIDAIINLHQCSVILVQVSDSDHDLLTDRVMREAINTAFDSVKYQDIRGKDWPSNNPGFLNLPRWIQLEIQSQLHKMFWFLEQ